MAESVYLTIDDYPKDLSETSLIVPIMVYDEDGNPIDFEINELASRQGMVLEITVKIGKEKDNG